MSNFIPLCAPKIGGNAWEYVKECLDTEWVSSAGTYVTRFEKGIADFVGAKHAVACVNGTAALHIALLLVGVEPDDEVLVPTLTFIAPVNAIRYVQANPVFMDCDSYFCIDSEKVCRFIKEETVFKNGFCYNKKSGRRISAIVPVHIFGNAVNMEEWVSLCKENNIAIVEDSTESLGTRYVSGTWKGKHTGTVGDIGCFSFNGNKLITTGGGGMLVTDNPAIAERAQYLTTQAKDDEIRYIHNEVGYNFRLTNIQAALGVAQVELLPEFISFKKSHFSFYTEHLLPQSGYSICPQPEYADNNSWMIALQIDLSVALKDREALMADLASRRIQTRPLWYLNHLQKPFVGFQAYDISLSPNLLETTLNIPCSVGLTPEDRVRVIEALHG